MPMVITAKHHLEPKSWSSFFKLGFDLQEVLEKLGAVDLQWYFELSMALRMPSFQKCYQYWVITLQKISKVWVGWNGWFRSITNFLICL